MPYHSQRRKSQRMKRRESLLVAVCIGVLSFFLFRFALVDCIEIWQTIESILGSLHPFMRSHVCIIALLTCCSLITALLTYQICMGKIHVLLLYFITALYLLLIFAIIMLKSRGISGFNVNPLLIVQELLQAPLTVLFNMLAFMPIGFISASPPKSRSCFSSHSLRFANSSKASCIWVFSTLMTSCSTPLALPLAFLRKTMPIPAGGACRDKGTSSPSANDDALEFDDMSDTADNHRIAQSQPAHGSIIQLNPMSTMRNSTFTAE